MKRIKYHFPSGQTKVYRVVKETEDMFVTETEHSYGTEVFEFDKEELSNDDNHTIVED